MDDCKQPSNNHLPELPVASCCIFFCHSHSTFAIAAIANHVMTWPNEAAVSPCSLGPAGPWHSTEAGMAPVGFQVQEGKGLGNTWEMQPANLEMKERGHLPEKDIQRTRQFHHASSIADFCFQPQAFLGARRFWRQRQRSCEAGDRCHDEPRPRGLGAGAHERAETRERTQH